MLPRVGVSTVEDQHDETARLHDGFAKSFCVQNLGSFSARQQVQDRGVVH